MKTMTDKELKIENARWQTSVMLRALDVRGCDNQMVQTMEEIAEKHDASRGSLMNT